MKPQWHEALYARARVSREKGDYQAALNDAVDAERFAPKQSLKEIQRLSERIREEMRRQVGVPRLVLLLLLPQVFVFYSKQMFES